MVSHLREHPRAHFSLGALPCRTRHCIARHGADIVVAISEQKSCDCN
jgi:hypothetical protein